MAFGQSTFSGFGTAISDIGQGIAQEGTATSDIFAAEAEGYKIQGVQFEQQAYDVAQQLALQNEEFAVQSTRIKAAQSERETLLSLGQTQADVAGAGLANSGNALDILRESASQGALTRAVIRQQGKITEAGYAEQAQSYALMASAAGTAISADKIAQQGYYAAADTAREAAQFSFIGAGISAAGALATLFV